MKGEATKQPRGPVRRPARKGESRRTLERMREDLELQNQSLRQAQFELELSRDHYVELFDTAPVCFVTLTPTGIIREINLPGIRLLSQHREHLAGWPFISFIASRDKKVFLTHLARCRENGDPMRPMSVELELKRLPDGKQTFIELVSIPTIEKVSRRFMLKNVFRDITDVKQMQGVHRWLAAIVESSDDAIIGKDLNSKIISCNHAASEFYGYAREELIGRSITILNPAGFEEEESKILQRLKSGTKFEHYETIRRRKDGSLVPVSLTISPIRDAQGRIVGASNIARDISQRKEYEKKLEESLERERAANHAKDDFLAALSHELRTPLSPVLLLASEGVRNREFPVEARSDFDTIRKNVELEARLIDDLLDLTRITKGRLVLNLKPTNVHAALQDAAATVRAEVSQKKIDLDLKLTADRDIVAGDSVRLRQVFWNVLKNAVKFTPQGGKIDVQTRILAGKKLIVEVSDTGIGMTADEIARVFGAFAQGNHHFGGLGLGLAISRALLDLHGGSIRAESAGKGRGALFSIELLLCDGAVQSERPVPPPPAPARKNAASVVRILLVEDHEPTRVSLAHLLVRRNYKVTPVASLSEARSEMKKEKFNLVISDIGLPDGTGYDLMAELRDAHLKAIALTGFGMEQDVDRSRAAGFSAHLTKPVRIEALDEALSVALTAKGA